MNVATIIIPCAYYHEHIVDRAVASANNQIVPCDVMVYFDKERGGAGHARNEGARDTDTDFLCFLDADDLLEPDFVEQCLRAYERGRYLYTGWFEAGKIKIPPAVNPFDLQGHYHLVTALIPTKAFNAVGGFDETLPGHEDADLFFKLWNIGICGKLVNKPLLYYTPDGQRGWTFSGRADYEQIKQNVYERNGGDRLMGCCGQPGTAAKPGLGDCREGDVKALCTWAGMKNQASVTDASRIIRGGNWQEVCVPPEDVAARPDLYKKTFDVNDLTPAPDEVLRKAGLI